MKKYIYIIIGLIILNILIIGAQFTYSSFYSTITGKTEDLTFAKINFNHEKSTEVSFSLGNLNPGEEKDYKFKVANYKDGSGSDINIGYQLTIETYHFIPTTIQLYKKNEITNLDELVLTCNEEDERNSENKLTCTSDIYTLDYKYQEQDDYSIKITYDTKDKNQNTWSEEYSELVDFIDIKIESWQLTEENTNERKA